MSDRPGAALLSWSLSARLLALLTLAILPIGLIAIYQARAVVEEATVLSRRDILVRTADAANAELSVIQRAFGAAHGLAIGLTDRSPTTPECSQEMVEFVDETTLFTEAMFVGVDGTVLCTSGARPPDLRRRAYMQAFFAEPSEMVSITESPVQPGQQVLVTLVPVRQEGRLIGVLAVHIPHNLSQTLLDGQIEDVDIALVNGDGRLLSSSADAAVTRELELAGIRPGSLAMGPLGTTQDITTVSGSQTTYAIVPLVRGELYAIGRWTAEQQPLLTTTFGTVVPLFPILMWLASLLVAFFGINSMVLRHLTVLRRRMGRFSLERPERSTSLPTSAPREVAEISETFDRMINRITEDHARLEDSVREKDILLKEVHHRVKNNLQLIASILNMQLRSIEAEDARRVLRRVQDRVISLSLIHKLLYTDTQLDAVRADRLLEEIIQSVLSVGSDSDGRISAKVELEPVMLDPDQAVPLSLLVTEAVTNAVKYVGNCEERGFIRISLRAGEDRQVFLEVENSRGAPGEDIATDTGTGLGSRLIRAFVSQLGGDMEVREDEETYALDIRFRKLAPATGGGET